MRAARARKPLIRVALVESDPLRVVGFRALFDAASGFELVAASLRDIGALQSIDLVLLSNCRVQNRVDLMASLKATRPDLRIIVTGSGDEETILKAIVAGAKGYVDEAASPAEFVQAVRVVSQGSVWAPRHVFSKFIERVRSAPAPAGRATFTDREKEVLELLVAGRSNKEIGSPLGIQERTVKAHVAKLMRKVGVQNRIALSVHALTQLVQQSVATANVTTLSGSCQPGFDCVDFTLAVPGVNAFAGVFSGSGTQYTQGNGAVSYQVDGQPVPHADGTPVCGQTDMMSSSVTVTPGNFFPAGTLSFTGCS